MEIVTSRPLRLSGNPGGQINIPINQRLTISDGLGRDMIDRGMAEEIKPDVVAMLEKKEKKVKKGE